MNSKPASTTPSAPTMPTTSPCPSKPPDHALVPGLKGRWGSTERDGSRSNSASFAERRTELERHNSRHLAGRRVSRHKALGYTGGGLVASALATAGLIQAGSAQDADATPAEEGIGSGVTNERVESASAKLDGIVHHFLARSGVPGL